jgi:hypothetical protein
VEDWRVAAVNIDGDSIVDREAWPQHSQMPAEAGSDPVTTRKITSELTEAMSDIQRSLKASQVKERKYHTSTGNGESAVCYARRQE